MSGHRTCLFCTSVDLRSRPWWIYRKFDRYVDFVSRIALLFSLIHYGALVAFMEKLYVESTPHFKYLWLDGDIPASNRNRKKIIITIEAMVAYGLPRSNKRVASFNADIVITEFHFYYSIYNVYIFYLNTSAPDTAITASTRHGTLVSSGPREGTMCAQIGLSVSGSISHCQSR